MQAALSLLIALIQNADKVSRLIQEARAEGRDITTEELDALFVESDVAMAEARAAVAEARSQD